jgi:sugar phosphate isomerase/epimerase
METSLNAKNSLSEPLLMALNAYGLPHVMGYLPTLAGEKYPAPLDALGVIETAASLNLAGVDIPVIGSLPRERMKDALEEHRLRIVAEGMILLNGEVADWRNYIETAAFVGAKTARAICSGLLCGDRRPLKVSGGWGEYRDRVAQRLREILPIAEAHGIALAIENHQDSTSDDLLWLYEKTGQSPAYGVCLDTGNPLAVGEGPVEFAGRVAPLIRHLHLKDYTIHFAPDGYRLVRCAAGTGCVDFRRILEIAYAESGYAALLPGIEVAAQPTRTISLLEDSWWAEFPQEQARFLPEALRVLWSKGIPADAPYSSVWERGEDSAAVSAEEWRLVKESVHYFSQL